MQERTQILERLERFIPDFRWAYWTQHVWEWLSGTQERRDQVDQIIRQQGSQGLQQGILALRDIQDPHYTYLQGIRYLHATTPYEYLENRSGQQVDWEAIYTRWLDLEPTQTTDEERQRRKANFWNEVNEVYNEEGGLSCTSSGHVYWRAVHIDHYKWPYDMLGFARTLLAHCLHLEELGLPVTSLTAALYADWFHLMTKDHPYCQLLGHLTCATWEKSTGELAFVRLHLEDLPGMERVDALYYDGTLWHRIRDLKNASTKRNQQFWSHARMERYGWQYVNYG